MRPNPPIIRPANHGQFPAPTSSASTTGLSGSVTGMNSALTPLAPLERWISYTQAEIVIIRSDLIQHLQAEIMKLRNDLISYHKQFADYQKICQSQLDVLTQQVRQSNQTMTEIQSSIIDLQNTQTEFVRNVEDVYRKLISLSSQILVGARRRLRPSNHRTRVVSRKHFLAKIKSRQVHVRSPSNVLVQTSETQLVTTSELFNKTVQIKPLLQNRDLHLTRMEFRCSALRWITRSLDQVQRPELSQTYLICLLNRTKITPGFLGVTFKVSALQQFSCVSSCYRRRTFSEK